MVINGDDDDDDEVLLDMLDATIVFQCYSGTGKMNNVHDWFKSFTIILEAPW
jgi:hypothetical protein